MTSEWKPSGSVLLAEGRFYCTCQQKQARLDNTIGQWLWLTGSNTMMIFICRIRLSDELCLHFNVSCTSWICSGNNWTQDVSTVRSVPAGEDLLKSGSKKRCAAILHSFVVKWMLRTTMFDFYPSASHSCLSMTPPTPPRASPLSSSKTTSQIPSGPVRFRWLFELAAVHQASTTQRDWWKRLHRQNVIAAVWWVWTLLSRC